MGGGGGGGGGVALQPFVGPWPLFQFLDPIDSW
jgi:hypothetical protein